MNTIEELLEQHDSYELGDGLSLGRRGGRPWFIYLSGVEIHFRANVMNDKIPFASVRSALVYLRTRGGVKAIEAARKREAEIPGATP